jgi:nitrite reductase/ring-hydroxylating ferredoxin subunit
MSKFKIQLKKTDFKEGELVKTEVGDKSIVLGMIKDRIYAMDSVCSHQGGPRGRMARRFNLTCPWHQGVFDIRTAKSSPKTNWVTDLKSYSVIVDEKSGEISVQID